MRGARPHEAGSVVIEALVAVLILAAMAGAWFSTLSGTVQRQRDSDTRALAMQVAASQLATVGVTAPAAAGTRNGRDGDFDWSIAVAAAGGSDGLVQVDVRVHDSAGAQLAQLSTIRPAA
ncbi:MAG: type IV pilus modification PilV family protein [Polymorphobacter sp.]